LAPAGIGCGTSFKSKIKNPKSKMGFAMSDDLFDLAFLERLEYLRVVSRRIFAGTTAGGRTGRRTGPGLEFSEHRAYAPGDDFRHLDWAAYGRLERLLLRLGQKDEDLSIYFLLDASASMRTGHPAKFDHARRVVAALAYVGLANLDRVGIAAVDGGVRAHLESGRGRARILTVLEFLRRLSAGGRTNLEGAVERFLPHAPRTGLAVLVSDLFDPAGYERPFLALLAGGFEPWCLHVTDRSDSSPVGVGDLVIEDAETGEGMGVYVGAKVRERLIAEAVQFPAEVRSWCLARGIGYAEAPTHLPVDVLVLDVLRRGGLLR